MYGLAAVLASLVGLSLGLLGGGGSILTVTILVYALHLDEKEAIATSLVVVAVTSAVAMVQHVRAGNVDWRVGATFGAAGMAGALVGGWIASWFSGQVLMVLFALMMVATALGMLRGRDAGAVPHRAAGWVIAAQGLSVGFATGLVGAGGGFLVVPALVLLGGLPMNKAIGTSLLVICLNSIAGVAGHLSHATIDLGLAGTFSAVAAVGAVLGSMASTRIDQAVLRRGFAVFVLVLGVVQLVNELV
ncbi:MAG: sulfite exporter TauE/SafE family protein [Myxococcota bacterium]